MSHFTEDDFPPEEEIRAYHQQLQAEPKHSRGQAIPEIEWLQAKPPYVPWGLDMEAGLAAMKRGKTLTPATCDVLRVILISALNYRQPFGKTTKATQTRAEVRLSQAEIAHWTGLSDRTVRTSVKELASHGLVKVRAARGGFDKSTYVVTPVTIERVRAATEDEEGGREDAGGGNDFRNAEGCGNDFRKDAETISATESAEPRPGREDGALPKEGNTHPGKVSGKSTQSTGDARVQKIAHAEVQGEEPSAAIETAKADTLPRKETAQDPVSNSKPSRRSDAALPRGDGGEGSSRPSQALTGPSTDVPGGHLPGWTYESAMEAVCELVVRHDRGDFQHRPQLHEEIARLVASRAPDAELQLFAISRRLGITGRNLGAVVNEPTQGQAAA